MGHAIDGPGCTLQALREANLMFTNIKEIRVRETESGNIESGFTYRQKSRAKVFEDVNAYVYMSKENALNVVNGSAQFVDGFQFVMTSKRGIVIGHFHSAEQHEILFPINWFREMFDCTGPELTVVRETMGYDEIIRRRRKYFARVKIAYCGDAEKWVKAASVMVGSNFRDKMRGIIRVSVNSPIEDAITLSISLDGIRKEDNNVSIPSFYWSINRMDGSRYMNGGIIWHGESYSTHT